MGKRAVSDKDRKRNPRRRTRIWILTCGETARSSASSVLEGKVPESLPFSTREGAARGLEAAVARVVSNYAHIVDMSEAEADAEVKRILAHPYPPNPAIRRSSLYRWDRVEGRVFTWTLQERIMDVFPLRFMTDEGALLENVARISAQYMEPLVHLFSEDPGSDTDSYDIIMKYIVPWARDLEGEYRRTIDERIANGDYMEWMEDYVMHRMEDLREQVQAQRRIMERTSPDSSDSNDSDDTCDTCTCDPF